MENLNKIFWIKEESGINEPYRFTSLDDNKAVLTSLQSQTTKKIDPELLKTLPFCNESTIKGFFENLINAPEFSNSAILYQLRKKYSKDEIYTFVGEILISINPFKRIPVSPTDFTSKLLYLHSSKPHVYSMANYIYNQTLELGKNHSIIISGESGSGKTEVNKMILNLITKLDSSAESIKEKILATMPILESFGNAKTIRNNNSSRFGKWQEIFITKKQISGFSIENYLLEKSRLVKLSEGERNFHVFYSLFHLPYKNENGKLLEDSEKAPVNLGLSEPTDYFYLNQGDCFTADSWDDSKCAESCIKAFKEIGFTVTEIDEVYRILGALLQLGNVQFGLVAQKEGSYVLDKKELQKAAELLEIDPEVLENTVSKKILSIGPKITECEILPEIAQEYRDTLTKTIYSELFLYITDRINKIGKPKESGNGSFIGTLDIFGFEVFEKNSLEQFCINWTNEKLQNNFTETILKFEKEEFNREGVQLNEIKFDSNSECLELIEKKGGVVSIINDEVTVPQGNDKQVLSRLKNELANNKFFKKPLNDAFIVKHFAGDVSYDIEGFVNKNRDKIPDHFYRDLATTKNSVLSSIFFPLAEEQKNRRGPSGASKKPLLFKFRANISKLIKQINSTDPYFIKCIKPNDTKRPNEFVGLKVSNQLLFTGINECLKLRKMNYPHRFLYEEFANRFKFILNTVPSERTGMSTLIEKLADEIYSFNSQEHCQIGNTKIMLTDIGLGLLKKHQDKKLENLIEIFKTFSKCYYYSNKIKKIKKKFLDLKNCIIKRNLQNMKKLMEEIRTIDSTLDILNVGEDCLVLENLLNNFEMKSFFDKAKAIVEKYSDAKHQYFKDSLTFKITLFVLDILNVLTNLESLTEEENNDFVSLISKNVEMLCCKEEKFEEVSDLKKINAFCSAIKIIGDNFKKIFESKYNLQIVKEYTPSIIGSFFQILIGLDNAFNSTIQISLHNMEIYADGLKEILKKIENFDSTFYKSYLKNSSLYGQSTVVLEIEHAIVICDEQINSLLELKGGKIQKHQIKDFSLNLIKWIDTYTKIKESSDDANTKIKNLKDLQQTLLTKGLEKNYKLVRNVEQQIQTLQQQETDQSLVKPPECSFSSDSTISTDPSDIEKEVPIDIPPLEKELETKLQTKPTPIESNKEEIKKIKDPESKPKSEKKPKGSKKHKKHVKEDLPVKTDLEPIVFVFPSYSEIKPENLFYLELKDVVSLEKTVESLRNNFFFQNCKLLRKPENFAKKHSLQLLGYNNLYKENYLIYASAAIPRSIVKFNAAYTGDKRIAKTIKLEGPKIFSNLLGLENNFVENILNLKSLTEKIREKKLASISQQIKNAKDDVERLMLVFKAKSGNYLSLSEIDHPKAKAFISSIKNGLKGLFSLAQNQKLVQDEIYCQLIKQTSNNNNLVSNFFYWTLIYLVSFLVVPSAEVSPYLTAHCARNCKPVGICRFGNVGELAARSLEHFHASKNTSFVPKMPPFVFLEYSLFGKLLFNIKLEIYVPDSDQPVLIEVNKTDGATMKNVIAANFTRITKGKSEVLWKKLEERGKSEFNFLDSLCFMVNRCVTASVSAAELGTFRKYKHYFNTLVHKDIPFVDICENFLDFKSENPKLQCYLSLDRRVFAVNDNRHYSWQGKYSLEYFTFYLKTVFIWYRNIHYPEMLNEQIAVLTMLRLMKDKKGKKLNSNDILHLGEEALLEKIPLHYRKRAQFHVWQSLIFKAATRAKFAKKTFLSGEELGAEFLDEIAKLPDFELSKFFVYFKNSQKFKEETFYILGFNRNIICFFEDDETLIDKHNLNEVTELTYDMKESNMRFKLKKKEVVTVSLFCKKEVFNCLNAYIKSQ